MASTAILSGVTMPAERRRTYVEAGYWDDSTLIKQIDHWAASTPGAIAIVDMEGRRRTSFKTIQADSCKVAGLLSKLGIGVGDVVAVQMPNWYETVAIGLGVLRLGAIINPLIPMYGAKELRLMLDVGETRLVVTPDIYRSSNYADRIKEATEGSSREVHHLRIPNPQSLANPLESLLRGVEPVSPGWYADAAAVSEVIFTSGTESLPKAILHTEQTTNFAVREWSKFLKLTPEDVLWMPMPIGHSTGFNYGVRLSLYHGFKLVLQDRWDVEVALDLCESEGITCTGVSPTHLLDMLKALRVRPRNLSKLRYYGCAGAPIPVGIVEAAAEFGITVLRGYGSTETLTVSKNHPDVTAKQLASADGRVLPKVEVELRKDDGQCAAPGQEGEIFVRSPSACVGFAPVAGQTGVGLPADGWIRTGDLGLLDHDGFLTIIGRKKEIIIRGGMNITPRELEEALIQHPMINQASVIGLPDPRLGEIVCACLVVKAGADLGFESVVEHLKQLDVATYKLPGRVEFLDAMPTTETGKVKKPELAAWVLSRPVSA